VERSRSCCEQLERGEILFLRDSSFLFSDDDRDILTRVPPAALTHKNIAYERGTGRVRGLRHGSEAQAVRVALARYCERSVRLCETLLVPYARSWQVELSSFRPLEERSRPLRGRQRNDLLHIDSFPSRPTNGARILRCFTNIHPSRPRIWITSGTLKTFGREMLLAARLERVARRAGSFWGRMWRRIAHVAHAFGVGPPDRSPYDQFMLRLHDYMKTDALYRSCAPIVRHEFPPGSTWLVFSDSVPHAVLEGQFALEQTFLIPRHALVLPSEAPIAFAERLARRRMTD
jgi:3-deoxy-D-manno-oct-2-ulosonic acid (Kdo) hydroxylase